MSSFDDERRGVGVNRFLDAMVKYCEHQLNETTRAPNKALMNERVYEELYKEIDENKLAFEYLLAGKKRRAASSGMSSLRSGIRDAGTDESGKSDAQLRDHAGKAYDWLDNKRPSRIRMLFKWQSGGGVSFVAQAYHRVQQC